MTRITKDQYEFFETSVTLAPEKISVQNFTDPTSRTLAYGFTAGHTTWHLYLDEGDLHLLVYYNVGVGAIEETFYRRGLIEQARLSPKRVYPQYTDTAYVALMRELLLPISFTQWDDPDDRGIFAGKTHKDYS